MWMAFLATDFCAIEHIAHSLMIILARLQLIICTQLLLHGVTASDYLWLWHKLLVTQSVEMPGVMFLCTERMHICINLRMYAFFLFGDGCYAIIRYKHKIEHTYTLLHKYKTCDGSHNGPIISIAISTLSVCSFIWATIMPRYSHLMPSNEHMMLSIMKGFSRELHGFSGIRYRTEVSFNWFFIYVFCNISLLWFPDKT